MLSFPSGSKTIKNPPAMWKIQVRSLGQEDPLEKEMAIHSRILAWENFMDRGVWWAAIAHGVTKSQTQLKQLSTEKNMLLN